MEKTESAMAEAYVGGEKEDTITVEEGRVSSTDSALRKENSWVRNLFNRGVETRGLLLQFSTKLFPQQSTGISPVPLDKRVNRPYTKIFFIWFSMNFNILSYVLL